MSLTKLDPNLLYPTAQTGHAQSVPDFYTTLIATINTSIDAINNAPGTSYPFVDLRAAPYSLVANDTSKATANRLGLAQAIADYTGTGANLHLGGGDWYFDWNSNSSNRSSIFFNASTRLELTGEGMSATRIIVQGDALTSDRYCIRVDNGASNISLHDFAIQAGTIVNPDPTQQNHLIQLGASTAATKDVQISRVRFGQCIGDQLHMAGTTSFQLSSVRVYQTVYHGAGIGLGARSAIGVQSGVNQVEISGFYIDGIKNSPIDFEPTGIVTINDWNIHDGLIDNSLGSSQVAASIGGDSTSNGRLFRLSMSNVTILEGQLQVFDTEGVNANNLTIYMKGASGPMAGGAAENLSVYGVVGAARFINLNCTRDTGGTLADGNCVHVVDHSGHGSPSRIDFVGGLLSSYALASPMRYDNADACEITGMHIRFQGSSGTGVAAITFNNTNTTINSFSVNGLVIEATTKLAYGIYGFAAGNNINNIALRGISAPGAVTTGVQLHETTSTIDRTPIIADCDFTGATNAWIGESAIPITPIIGGNRGGRPWFEGLASPESVVTAPQGSLYTWLNGDSTQLLLKCTGTGNTGWKAVTHA